MSYYNIPSHTSSIKFEVISSNNEPLPFVSHSLHAQLSEIDSYALDAMNPYNYLHQVVPGTETSVSKNAKTSFYFEVIEAFHMLYMNDWFESPIINVHSNEANIIDFIPAIYDLNVPATLMVYSIDPLNIYAVQLWELLWRIYTCQAQHGSCILKIGDMVHKFSVDFLFILSLLYEKVYITKPSVSNAANGERLLVCKNFQSTELFTMTNPSSQFLSGQHIHSFIRTPIPCYFLFKIEELNVLFGQSQLDAIKADQKRKKKDEKDVIEATKRTNIQKCVQWCEKYNVSHHKFVETVNIFLMCSPQSGDKRQVTSDK